MLKLYDKSKINKNDLLFDSKALYALMIPIILEQLLNSFMGMADSMMVSNVSSAAISAVSLVDSINILVIQVFAALAAGATIICSQYIGSNDKAQSNNAARQVVIAVLAISLSITVFCISLRRPLLILIFGQVEADVMEASLIYFFITALSFPFIALFNAGSAFYRAGGNSRFPMKVSVISNVMNIGLNAVFIFGFKMGVLGAALATLISRIFCVLVIYYYLRKPRQIIVINSYHTFRADFPLIIRVLAVGIPTGIENGMFQFGKLAIQSTVSTLGTTAIAANAMATILENLNGIGAMGIGIGLMTLVGQAMGAGRREEAKYYIVQMTKLSYIVVFVSVVITYIISRPVMYLAGFDTECLLLTMTMVNYYTIVKPIIWPMAFVPGYGMRAAGDVKYSMIATTLTMWFGRVLLSIYFMRVLHMGPLGVWVGMSIDWFLRAGVYIPRYFSGKWMKNVI